MHAPIRSFIIAVITQLCFCSLAKAVSPPTILTHPLSQTVAVGASANFTVVASGVAPLRYQWKKNGVALSGQTSAALTLNNCTTADAGDYTCEVSNVTGSTTSAVAKLTIEVGLKITVQPKSQTCEEGASVTFTCEATGNGSLKYQWKKNGTTLAGQTGASLTLNNCTSADAGDYVCEVTDATSTMPSAVAKLVVELKLKITLQPQNQSCKEGASVTFTCQASGNGTLKYQWKKNGVALAGKTSASLTLENCTVLDAGDYVCEVSDAASTLSSAIAKLIVELGLRITVQPQNQSCKEGTSVTFTCEASGNGALKYQWKKNGVALTGKTSASLTLENCTSLDAGDYVCEVSDATSSVTSAVAKLTVELNLKITLQPKSQSCKPGDSVTLTCEASGSGTLKYQWKKNGVALVGKTSASLTLENCTVLDAGDYVCEVSDAASTLSSAVAKLIVELGLRITVQPQNQSCKEGASVTFTCEASGNGALKYQWKKNGVALTGKTSASLTVENCTSLDAGDYVCEVTDAASTVTSAVAKLIVELNLKITLQPKSQSCKPGESVTFTCEASGNVTVKYQWKKNGVALAGKTSATLKLDNCTSADVGDYICEVSDSSQTLSSSIAKLVLDLGLAITVQPKSQTCNSGGNVTLTVEATGKGVLKFQWKKNGVALSNQTSATLMLQNCSSADVGNYVCEISDEVGNLTSQAATVQVCALVRESGRFQLAVPTEGGKRYVFEFNNSLSGEAWTKLSQHNGDGNAAVLTDLNANTKVRFYRFRQE